MSIQRDPIEGNADRVMLQQCCPWAMVELSRYFAFPIHTLVPATSSDSVLFNTFSVYHASLPVRT